MKKKFVAIALACILSTIPVSADIPDISGLTLEELTELQSAVNQAVIEKGGYVDIYEGVYVVGKDIRSGMYTIYRPEDAHSVWDPVASIFESEDTYEEFAAIDKSERPAFKDAANKYSSEYFVLTKGNNCSVTLEDGMVLHIGYGALKISASTFAFAPN